MPFGSRWQSPLHQQGQTRKPAPRNVPSHTPAVAAWLEDSSFRSASGLNEASLRFASTLHYSEVECDALKPEIASCEHRHGDCDNSASALIHGPQKPPMCAEFDSILRHASKTRATHSSVDSAGGCMDSAAPNFMRTEDVNRLLLANRIVQRASELSQEQQALFVEDVKASLSTSEMEYSPSIGPADDAGATHSCSQASFSTGIDRKACSAICKVLASSLVDYTRQAAMSMELKGDEFRSNTSTHRVPPALSKMLTLARFAECAAGMHLVCAASVCKRLLYLICSPHDCNSRCRQYIADVTISIGLQSIRQRLDGAGALSHSSSLSAALLPILWKAGIWCPEPKYAAFVLSVMELRSIPWLCQALPLSGVGPQLSHAVLSTLHDIKFHSLVGHFGKGLCSAMDLLPSSKELAHDYLGLPSQAIHPNVERGNSVVLSAKIGHEPKPLHTILDGDSAAMAAISLASLSSPNGIKISQLCSDLCAILNQENQSPFSLLDTKQNGVFDSMGNFEGTEITTSDAVYCILDALIMSDSSTSAALECVCRNLVALFSIYHEIWSAGTVFQSDSIQREYLKTQRNEDQIMEENSEPPGIPLEVMAVTCAQAKELRTALRSFEDRSRPYLHSSYSFTLGCSFKSSSTMPPVSESARACPAEVMNVAGTPEYGITRFARSLGMKNSCQPVFQEHEELFGRVVNCLAVHQLIPRKMISHLRAITNLPSLQKLCLPIADGIGARSLENIDLMCKTALLSSPQASKMFGNSHSIGLQHNAGYQTSPKMGELERQIMHSTSFLLSAKSRVSSAPTAKVNDPDMDAEFANYLSQSCLLQLVKQERLADLPALQPGQDLISIVFRKVHSLLSEMFANSKLDDIGQLHFEEAIMHGFSVCLACGGLPAASSYVQSVWEHPLMRDGDLRFQNALLVATALIPSLSATGKLRQTTIYMSQRVLAQLKDPGKGTHSMNREYWHDREQLKRLPMLLSIGEFLEQVGIASFDTRAQRKYGSLWYHCEMLWNAVVNDACTIPLPGKLTLASLRNKGKVHIRRWLNADKGSLGEAIRDAVDRLWVGDQKQALMELRKLALEYRSNAVNAATQARPSDSTDLLVAEQQCAYSIVIAIILSVCKAARLAHPLKMPLLLLRATSAIRIVPNNVTTYGEVTQGIVPLPLMVEDSIHEILHCGSSCGWNGTELCANTFTALLLTLVSRCQLRHDHLWKSLQLAAEESTDPALCTSVASQLKAIISVKQTPKSVLDICGPIISQSFIALAAEQLPNSVLEVHSKLIASGVLKHQFSILEPCRVSLQSILQNHSVNSGITLGFNTSSNSSHNNNDPSSTRDSSTLFVPPQTVESEARRWAEEIQIKHNRAITTALSIIEVIRSLKFSNVITRALLLNNYFQQSADNPNALKLWPLKESVFRPGIERCRNSSLSNIDTAIAEAIVFWVVRGNLSASLAATFVHIIGSGVKQCIFRLVIAAIEPVSSGQISLSCMCRFAEAICEDAVDHGGAVAVNRIASSFKDTVSSNYCGAKQLEQLAFLTAAILGNSHETEWEAAGDSLSSIAQVLDICGTWLSRRLSAAIHSSLTLSGSENTDPGSRPTSDVNSNPSEQAAAGSELFSAPSSVHITNIELAPRKCTPVNYEHIADYPLSPVCADAAEEMEEMEEMEPINCLSTEIPEALGGPSSSAQASHEALHSTPSTPLCEIDRSFTMPSVLTPSTQLYGSAFGTPVGVTALRNSECASGEMLSTEISKSKLQRTLWEEEWSQTFVVVQFLSATMAACSSDSLVAISDEMKKFREPQVDNSSCDPSSSVFGKAYVETATLLSCHILRGHSLDGCNPAFAMQCKQQTSFLVAASNVLYRGALAGNVARSFIVSSLLHRQLFNSLDCLHFPGFVVNSTALALNIPQNGMLPPFKQNKLECRPGLARDVATYEWSVIHEPYDTQGSEKSILFPASTVGPQKVVPIFITQDSNDKPQQASKLAQRDANKTVTTPKAANSSAQKEDVSSKASYVAASKSAGKQKPRSVAKKPPVKQDVLESPHHPQVVSVSSTQPAVQTPLGTMQSGVQTAGAAKTTSATSKTGTGSAKKGKRGKAASVSNSTAKQSQQPAINTVAMTAVPAHPNIGKSKAPAASARGGVAKRLPAPKTSKARVSHANSLQPPVADLSMMAAKAAQNAMKIGHEKQIHGAQEGQSAGGILSPHSPTKPNENNILDVQHQQISPGMDMVMDTQPQKSDESDSKLGEDKSFNVDDFFS